MDISAVAPDALSAPFLIAPLTQEAFQSGTLAPSAVARAAHLVNGDFSAEKGDSVLVYVDEDEKSRRVILVGLGSQGDVSAETLRQAAAHGAGEIGDREAPHVDVLLPDILEAEKEAQAIAEGFVLASYRFQRYKSETKASTKKLNVATPGQSDTLGRALRKGRVRAEAACTARDLVNLSPDEKSATHFATLVRESATLHGYDVTIWGKDRIESERMGGLLAVNRGSPEPPTFSMLEWHPEEPANEKPIVLVGKGVMFDTGGLSLKDTKNSMDMMKADMAGAATVVGAFEAIADLNLPLHVIGLIPATDNRPGGNAYVPGDVIRMHNGSTVEVMNTDAEGRMLLADALSFAQQYEPELVVDFATLTGSAVVALGHEAAALMTRDDDEGERLAESLIAAGDDCGERVRPLPMFEEYAKLLESEVADCKNVGGRAAGAITAGKFLEQFVDYPWMHLDIAGTAFLQEAKPYSPKGGTGFGVRLMAEFLSQRSES